LRLRLTLWFVVAVVVIIAAIMVGVYAVLSEQLRSDLDTRLVQQINRYQEAVASASDVNSLFALTREYLAGNRGEALGRAGFVLSLLTKAGDVVSNSSEVRPEELPQAKDLLSSGVPFSTEARWGSETYRVAGTVVKLKGEPVAAIFVAGSMQSILDTLRRLLVLLGLGGLVGCGAVGLGSWVLLGQALEPVRRITRTAAAITREDLSRRIGYEGPNDEIGELARTMDAMLDRLEQAFALQERFISDVSHELRTPITIAKGHLQVLDRQSSPSAELMREEHALVIEELDRMDRLVGDLLTLARAGRADLLQKEPVDLDVFLKSLVQQGPHLGDREWKIDSLPGGTIEADQDRLTQVFLNLLHNAVAHTKEGQVIAVGGRWRSDGRAVSLWVRDEGEGMGEEVRRQVFERFYRGEGRPSGGRVGLGLAIARALVEAHGGTIEVESSPGRGAKFVVTLPASYSSLRS